MIFACIASFCCYCICCRLLSQETAFMSSYVTDRPAPPAPSTAGERHSHSDPAACVSVQNEIHTLDNNSPAAVGAEFSPEAVCPFPKAEPRKNTQSSRRKRHCAILTDTPVKRALKQEKEQQSNKKLGKKPTEKQTRKPKKNLFASPPKEPQKPTKKQFLSLPKDPQRHKKLSATDQAVGSKNRPSARTPRAIRKPAWLENYKSSKPEFYYKN